MKFSQKKMLMLIAILGTNVQVFAQEAGVNETTTGKPVKEAVQAAKAVRGELRGEMHESAAGVRAETAGQIKTLRTETRENVRLVNEDTKNRITNIRNSSSSPVEKKEDVKNIRQEARQEKGDLREQRKEQVEAERADFKKNIEAKREEVKKKNAENKAILAEKLKLIKDTKKQEAVTRVSENVNSLNAKMVDVASGSVARLEENLLKLEGRLTEIKAKGIDVSPLEGLDLQIKAAIEESRSAISLQASKTYTVTFATESTLKTDVSKTRELLKADLVTLKEKIKSIQVLEKTLMEAISASAKSSNGTASN